MENILVFFQKRKELKCFSNQNVPDFIIIFSSSGPVRSQIFTSEKKEKKKKRYILLEKTTSFLWLQKTSCLPCPKTN